MNKRMTINDIPKVSETVFENITFVEPTYTSASHSILFRLKDRIFKNCKFKKFAMSNLALGLINCVFENCIFDSKAVIADLTHCTFRNCTFSDGFKSAFGLFTTFFECDYDDSFLESLSKEMVCPVSGEFVGWKKAYLCKRLNNSLATKINPVIVKLLIPSKSRRSSGLSNKCRCEKAMVLEVQTEDGRKIDISEEYIVVSMYEFKSMHPRLIVSMDDLQTRYIPGEMVYPDKFDPDPLVECGGGIHFFMTREEALNYDFY